MAVASHTGRDERIPSERLPVSDLIDTTEMYLRTVFELQEEGVPPLRARIAERLGQSGPTVSQTVARMERDGLLEVGPDRRITLTETGQLQATRVMRKHRLAERLLADVIGLDWEDVHAEACRWEHVISDKVEQRLIQLLDHPTQSPFGNPIPGLRELDPEIPQAAPSQTIGLLQVVAEATTRHTVAQIAEALQEDPGLMTTLRRSGVSPGATITASREVPGGLITVGSAGEYAELTEEQAAGITVLA